MALRRFCYGMVLAGCMLGASVSSGFSAKDSAQTASGLPVPRYVSLKSDHVNVRAGPTKDNDVAWVYTRSGLPVEITAEFENWRRGSRSAGRAGATSPATVLTAGSNSNGCGASMRMRRWISHLSLPGLDPAIHLVSKKAFDEERWIRGSSPRMTS
jgi:SH3-like domain-containing protein